MADLIVLVKNTRHEILLMIFCAFYFILVYSIVLNSTSLVKLFSWCNCWVGNFLLCDDRVQEQIFFSPTCQRTVREVKSACSHTIEGKMGWNEFKQKKHTLTHEIPKLLIVLFFFFPSSGNFKSPLQCRPDYTFTHILYTSHQTHTHTNNHCSFYNTPGSTWL